MYKWISPPSFKTRRGNDNVHWKKHFHIQNDSIPTIKGWIHWIFIQLLKQPQKNIQKL